MRIDRWIRWSLFIPAIVLTGGCASSQGLSLDPLQREISQEESRFFDSQAAPGPSVPANAPRLGLYLKPTGFVYREFEWTGRDRDVVLAWSQRVPIGAGGKSTGFLTQSSLKGDRFTELRASAIRYGIDWILVVDGAAAVDRYNNYKAGLWYWTIVGAYVADGTQSDALCLLKATLWDVKTGARLLEEEAQAQTKAVGPAALVDDNQEIERAKTSAMNILLERLTDRFAKLARMVR